MTLRRLLLASSTLATVAGCRDAAGPSFPALTFDARPVPAARSAVTPVTIVPGTGSAGGGHSAVVRGGFFVGESGYVLEAQLERTTPTASRLTVRAVPGVRYDVFVSHFDYQAVVALPEGTELTVVHAVAGSAAADTVYRGRPL